MIQIKSSLSTETLDNLDPCSFFYRRVKGKNLVVKVNGSTMVALLVESWPIIGN